MPLKVACGIYARNEGPQLSTLFRALFSQSYPFTQIVFLNDGSSDETPRVINDIEAGAPVPVDVIHEPPHKSYILTGQMYRPANMVYERLYRYDHDYFLICGADTVLSANYVKEMVGHISRDRKLMVASGHIIGEPYTVAPRGSGRVYNTGFMKRWARPLPRNYTWESYPMYKAVSLGLHARAFESPQMRVSRPTRSYKDYYGLGMRQLGYFSLYAYLVGLKKMLKNKEAINIIRQYRAGVKAHDPELEKWLKHTQAKKLLDPRIIARAVKFLKATYSRSL